MMTIRVSIKLRANLVGSKPDTQSYRESKRPGRELLGTHFSFQRDVINPSSILSGGSVSRGLFGGRPAIDRCTQAKNQLTEQSWGIEA